MPAGSGVVKFVVMPAASSWIQFAPGMSVVAVHDPSGATQNLPSSPTALQPMPVTPRSLVAPMSADTTATRTLGRPIGSACRTCMKVGSCRRSFCCMVVIDDELSTMNRMSMSLLTFSVTLLAKTRVGVTTGASMDREVQAQTAGTAAARPAQRNARQPSDKHDVLPDMDVLLGALGRTGAPGEELATAEPTAESARSAGIEPANANVVGVSANELVGGQYQRWNAPLAWSSAIV